MRDQTWQTADTADRPPGAPEAGEPQPGPERKRLRLLDAAAESFASLGYAKSTIEEIARAAGVSKGLLYVHYRSKEELLLAVVARTLEEWDRESSAAYTQATSARDQLERMHQASLQYAASHPLLFRIFAQDPRLVRSLVEDIAAEAQRSWLSELRTLFEEGKHQGEFRKDLNVDHAARSYCLLHLSFLDRLMERDDLEVNDPGLITSSIGFLLDGMK